MSPSKNQGSPDPEGKEGAAPARRRFLIRLCLALGGLSAGVLLVPLAALLLLPLRRRSPLVWRPVGLVDDFPIGVMKKVTYLDPEPLEWAGLSAESAAWVQRTGEAEFLALGIYCTHVGCPVSWFEGAQLLMCPCHGGAFYRDGSIAAGPPPRPLPAHAVRVRDGVVEVQPMPIQAALGVRRRYED